MKKTMELKSVLYGVIMGLLIGVIAVSIGFTISTIIKIRETEAEIEKIDTKIEILENYGLDAYNTFVEIDEEFQSDGRSIVEYKIYYMGDTMRLRAESSNGGYTDRPVKR